VHFFTSYWYDVGWLLHYKTPTNANFFAVNEGLAGRTPIPPFKVTATTSDSQLSVVWVARTASLEIRKVFTLDSSGLFLTTAVSLRNIDTAGLTGLYCKIKPHFI